MTPAIIIDPKLNHDSAKTRNLAQCRYWLTQLPLLGILLAANADALSAIFSAAWDNMDSLLNIRPLDQKQLTQSCESIAMGSIHNQFPYEINAGLYVITYDYGDSPFLFDDSRKENIYLLYMMAYLLGLAGLYFLHLGLLQCTLRRSYDAACYWLQLPFWISMPFLLTLPLIATADDIRWLDRSTAETLALINFCNDVRHDYYANLYGSVPKYPHYAKSNSAFLFPTMHPLYLGLINVLFAAFAAVFPLILPTLASFAQDLWYATAREPWRIIATLWQQNTRINPVNLDTIVSQSSPETPFFKHPLPTLALSLPLINDSEHSEAPEAT